MRRRRARDSILHYAEAIDVPGRPATEDPDADFFLPIETRIAPHHRLILQAFDRTSKRKHGRLMVFLPPGSAKSTYGSVVFPTRYLSESPNRKLILASYGDDLARKMGRRARQICRSDKFKTIWGNQLSRDTSAAEQWTLTNGSEYMATGIRSGVTGNRANGIVIDDPIKGRAEANSKVFRETTWAAYQDDLLTRLIPGGWLALIQTRWHEDDMAGRILPDGWDGESGIFNGKDGHEWEVLCIQAKCEEGKDDPLGRLPGQYLWPEWFDPKHWVQFEAVPTTWHSLFQQRPRPIEGDVFKPNMIGIVDAIPAGTKLVRGWDLAGTKDGGDYTAGGLLGKQPDGRYIIADIERGQHSPEDVERTLKNTADRDGPYTSIRIPQDPGQAGKHQIKALARLLGGYYVNSLPATGDKVTNALPLAAQVNVGNVCMLRGAWNKALIEEMRVFPGGTHDDQIDALSQAFDEIEGTTTGLIDYYSREYNKAREATIN